jgi:hypothetical protein
LLNSQPTSVANVTVTVSSTDGYVNVDRDPHGKHEKLNGDCWLEPSDAHDGWRAWVWLALRAAAIDTLKYFEVKMTI